MKEVDWKQTNRAVSYQLYINAPMPMVTIFKTLDITKLLFLKKQGYKLNMLMCYCIALAAKETKEFYLLPVGKKLYEYDQIGINVIVANKDGGINTCDIPYYDKLIDFNQAYLTLTSQVALTCQDHEISDTMIVGTSSLVKYEIDGIINMYSGIYNNPFMLWGKYQEDKESVKLKVSFQFHHVQMDGNEACAFLERLQEKINNLNVD
ncbi:CatA-like O-acetyltransferase, family 2 [Thomasclavelia sp.]|uniref:CatA-like O-acetyltransferase, family 2 n=1 Tax=Thomasclavelia sp. TaxID=3025757 RepID=UPI0025CE2DE4|nr:CatA-like O-acetyltransferase, family 2 [Thomasclavelia sp.]